MLPKQHPFNLLDDCHLNIDINQRYEMIELNARKLLTYQRFDLYAILLYIDHKVKHMDMEYATRVYKERTRAATGYSFKEAGNESKNSFNKYLDTLNTLIETFRTGEFDPEMSIIPIDKYNILIDGAHRVACAAYFNKNVTVVKFPDWDTKMHVDSTWLAQKHVDQEILDAIAMEYCNWHKNIYALIFWPKSSLTPRTKGMIDRLFGETCSVVYRRRVKLNYGALRNFILQIYYHMDWVGSIEDNFVNTYEKANQVYDRNHSVEIVLVEADSVQQIAKLKQKIRKTLDMGLSSLHSTDNWRQTCQVVNLIFNKNSLHHLEYGEPDKYSASYKLIEEYKNRIQSVGHRLEDYVIDSSMVMSIYGMREAGDLDYLTINSERFKIELLSNAHGLIDSHHEFIQYHNASLVDLVFNPQKHFVYNNIKFVSLEQLNSFKYNRNEKKDIFDRKLIKSYFHRRQNIEFVLLTVINHYKRYRTIFKALLITKLMNVLKTIRIYNILRKIYNCNIFNK